mmetsp:Transcript_7203/g.6389  ORF Transcript_7203/g.6389 Transcript_7203/m.6389 type:complete len:190 (+) Transcript_7203:711-1280(+)
MRISTLRKVYQKEIKKHGKTLLKMKKNRPDAQIASLPRFWKKTPTIFLHYIGSKCKYKSRDPLLFAREWMKVFLKCFCPLYEIEPNIELRIRLFLDSIILSLPDVKVLVVIELFYDKDSEEYKNYLYQLDHLRREVSKIKMIELYNRNSFFKLVADKYSSFIPEKSTDLKKVTKEILGKIQQNILPKTY